MASLILPKTTLSCFLWTVYTRSPIHLTSLMHQVKQHGNCIQFLLYCPVRKMVISDLTVGLNHFQKGPSLSTDSEDLSASSKVPKLNMFWAGSSGRAKLIRFSSNLPQSTLLVQLPLTWIVVMVSTFTSDYSQKLQVTQNRGLFTHDEQLSVFSNKVHINTSCDMRKKHSYLVTPFCYMY